MNLGWLSLARTPEAFHGQRALAAGLRGRPTRAYFEGWYVKLVTADLGGRIALIPGVFLGSGPGADVPREAFVQVLDGMTGASAYHRFELADFQASDQTFEVRVGPNRFDLRGLEVDLPALDGVPALSGRVEYRESPEGWPITWKSPGVMGWYGWLPFLECYHGLVGFGHGLGGALGGIDFTGGRGYIEKDWGQAFPQAYIWMATNHFSDDRLSLMGSIAIVPWRGSAFRGFLVGLRTGDGLRVFATHTGAHTESLAVTEHEVRWTLVDRDGYRLDLACDRPRGGLLAAPIRTQMHRRVEETLDAQVGVRLWSPDRRLLLSDTGLAAGLEVHGDIPKLLEMA